MSKFKVGDKVKIVAGGGYYCDSDNYTITHIIDSGFKSEEKMGEIVEIKNIFYSNLNKMFFYDCGVGNKWSENCFECGEVKLLTNKIEKIMGNIKTFVKNLALSADEKILRKYGFKSDCGEYTQDARDLAILRLCESTEKEMVEIAKGLEKEEKAK